MPLVREVFNLETTQSNSNSRHAKTCYGIGSRLQFIAGGLCRCFLSQCSHTLDNQFIDALKVTVPDFFPHQLLCFGFEFDGHKCIILYFKVSQENHKVKPQERAKAQQPVSAVTKPPLHHSLLLCAPKGLFEQRRSDAIHNATIFVPIWDSKLITLILS